MPGSSGWQPVVVRFWRRRARRLPDSWAEVVAGSLGEWAYLNADERARLGELIDGLLAGKGWEAARGFVLTDEMCTIIAAQAALMVLAQDLGVYRDVRAIIVHPTTVTSTAPRPGPVPGVVSEEPIDLLGEAHQQRGPIVLAWDSVLDDARHPGTGRNVVIHEFAHKLDMLDGLIDGTPPVAQREAYRRWVEVCTAEFERLRASAGDPLLRDYASQDPGEFFAVAAEVFFDQPEPMRDLKPDLYGVFVDYFLQDPASRRRPG
jgi:Mlc titration factor MtfA (ptsG expression regulator)